MTDEELQAQKDAEAAEEQPTIEELQERLKVVEAEKAELEAVSRSKSDAISHERGLRKKLATQITKQGENDEALMGKIQEAAEKATKKTMVELAEKEVINEFIEDFPESEKMWDKLQDQYEKEYKDMEEPSKKIIRKRLEYLYSNLDEETFKVQQEKNIRQEERRAVHQSYAQADATPRGVGNRGKGTPAITPEQEEMSRKFGLDPQEVYKKS